MVRLANQIGAAVAAFALLTAPTLSAPSNGNGLPDDPNFFPIGVWLQQPRNAVEFSNLGVNLIVGLWKGPTEVQLAVLEKNHMFVITDQNDVGLTSVNNAVIKGWLLPDEPDNAQRNSNGGYDPCMPPANVAALTRQFKARDSSRPVFINFGQGVADPTWIGRGTCTGDMEYYSKAMQGADIVSFDIYPVATSRPNIQGKLEYVGRGVDQLVKRASPGQSVWAVIETTHINSSSMVSPTQLRAEVWMALVHGARGIVYFVHEWTGGFREDGIFRHTEIVAAVTDVNRTIGALAPILKSPNATDRAVVAPPGISTMLKKQGQTLYLFVVSERASATQARFQISGLPGSANMTVLNEDRRIDLQDGRFSDAFSGYGVHIYKLAPLH